MKITWGPRTGVLHFESNLQHVELLGILSLVEFAAIRQMSGGQGTGMLAEGRIQGPALLQPRRLP